MPAHAGIHFERELEIDLRALGDARKRRARPGFLRQISTKALRSEVECRQANAADCNAVTFLQFFGGLGRLDGDAMITAPLDNTGNTSNLVDQTGKHDDPATKPAEA